MSKLALAAAALSVFALGAPAVTFAATTESSVHQRHAVPHKAHMSQRERMRAEGLSANPRNCVKYGCVGNN
jgi:hypothetical protein